jgi:hypothetical protein
MAVTETYRLDELDDETRDYLQRARKRRGRGMPGYYVGRNNALPVVALICGIAIVITTFCIAFPPINEPLAEAMLQTAGFLLGGWCIVAAFRMWGAIKSGKSLGNFTYADSEYLWECSGASITVTDLIDLDRAKATHTHNNEGNYQSSSIVIHLRGTKRTLTLSDAEAAERLSYFLNVLPGLRAGESQESDEGDERERGDGDYEVVDDRPRPRKLTAAQIGGIAAAWASGDDVPSDATENDLELKIVDIPHPQRTGTASSGMLQCLIIVGVAIFGVIVFKQINVPLRDDAIFGRIEQIVHQPSRAPWLRAYLADARNTRHRAEAQKMLDKIYDDALARVKAPLGPQDEELKKAFTELVQTVKGLPQPALSVGVKGPNNDPKAAQAEEVQKVFLEQIEKTLGEAVLALVKAPEGVNGLIEVAWDFEEPKDPFGQGMIRWTISFRKKPDDNPVTFVRKMAYNGLDKNTPVRTGATALAQMMIGTQQAPPPPVINDDF